MCVCGRLNWKKWDVDNKVGKKMGICKARVTKKSDCFRWLRELIYLNITEFRFSELPDELKNRSMLHRATASGLLVETNVDNSGVKTWKLNMYGIMRISNET